MLPMRNWLRRLLLRWELRLRRAPIPRPADQTGIIRSLSESLKDMIILRDQDRRDYVERCHELFEARQMSGTGPWLPESRRDRVDEPRGRLREAFPTIIGVAESNVGAQGSMGQLELDLQNVDWRREINLSWLEFSRWGIQQIILISRLYYIKNPLIRRLLDVDAAYVMGKYFIAASEDESVNDAIQEFLKFNSVEFGHSAMVENQKRTNYDGNLFFVFFPDTQGSGLCPTRQIDATEIQDLITNPNDVTEEWYYRRTWSTREFVAAEGHTRTVSHEAWYPSVFAKTAADAEGSDFIRQTEINGYAVQWESPVMHAKFGFAGRWTFGCPRVYPALDWAKADRRYLEACATLAASHAQIAMTISTKGGAQALAGVKQQLETTVGPTTQVFDTNPTANNASIFASGPGTTLEAFGVRGKGLDPVEHRQYAVMAAICLGVPPTWVGDMETANLATATTLDRPTEAGFETKQESWRELMTAILLYAMNVQLRATKGGLRESLERRGFNVAEVRLTERPRVYEPRTGKMIYISEAQRKQPKKPTDLEITVQFPPIREGDLPALMGALVESITLNGFEAGNGIDVKEGIKAALALVNSFSQTDIDVEELIEKMYPTAQYKSLMDRTKVMQAEQEQALAPPPAPVADQPDVGTPPEPSAIRKAHPKKIDAAVGEAALTRLGWAHERIARLLEARRGRKAA
jgi:hypothetical protein